MGVDLYFRNAQIVTDQKSFYGGITVKNELIEEVIEGDPAIEAKETIDVRKKLLMPGIVDTHVHFNEPGRVEWEGFETGSYAAAASGITTVFDMPFNSLPVTLDLPSLSTKLEAIKSKSIVDYGLWGLVGKGNLDKLAEMHENGVIGFKGFMCDPGEFDLLDGYELYEAMKIVAGLDNLISFHAEGQPLIAGFTDAVKKTGRKDPQAWLDSHPPLVELDALERAILFAKNTGCKIHLAHTTLPEGFDSIVAAQKQGAKITGETCPHYLYFDEEDFKSLGAIAKCSPPIRSREAVEGLWKHIFAGNVELLCSDHSPTTAENKHLDENDIWKVWGGISGVQLMLPVLFTEGVHKRGLPIETLVKLTSANPARLYGLDKKKGLLKKGNDADLVIFDPDKEWQFSPEMILSRNKLSPYINKKFKGAVQKTYLRGKLIYSDGKIVEKPGYGQFVKPIR